MFPYFVNFPASVYVETMPKYFVRFLVILFLMKSKKLGNKAATTRNIAGSTCFLEQSITRQHDGNDKSFTIRTLPRPTPVGRGHPHTSP